MKKVVTYRRTLGAKTLIGDPVVDRTGADIGKIEELMIDVATGRVAYAVLSYLGDLEYANGVYKHYGATPYWS
jgi:sporulation protein YlmC with PRC-barrel domain